ncbi:hypothetical protein W822_19070 [Advenella kashmirensis W13003]|uniref:DUF2335 domain-containing protein n=1 Tax=Advenella kashmirensis W13003 TaxID=1424334 RepID=V8QR05_9BURK|nr:hypothetical protein [Advenella kashmirensis]ETF01424.1 hypothetical protein W822_19070 [Advenella kashmirensis W13003]
MSHIPSPQNTNPSSLNEATINRLLDTHIRDQELKLRELTVREREIEQQAKFATKTLEAEMRDRAAERSHIQTTVRYRLYFCGTVCLGLMIFCGFGLYQNKDALEEKMITIIASAGFGAFGGYGYRVYAEKSSDEAS